MTHFYFSLFVGIAEKVSVQHAKKYTCLTGAFISMKIRLLLLLHSITSPHPF